MLHRVGFSIEMTRRAIRTFAPDRPAARRARDDMIIARFPHKADAQVLRAQTCREFSTYTICSLRSRVGSNVPHVRLRNVQRIARMSKSDMLRQPAVDGPAPDCAALIRATLAKELGVLGVLSANFIVLINHCNAWFEVFPSPLAAIRRLHFAKKVLEIF